MADSGIGALAGAASWWRTPPDGLLRIEGGRPLAGTIAIAGAKNAALPLMVCAALTDAPLTLANLPRILDVAVLANILERLGVAVSWAEAADGLSATFRGTGLGSGAVDGALVGRMRASFLIAGALLARLGRVRLPLPGGDAIGSRPIDYHLDGFRQMGAAVALEGGTVALAAPHGLHGAAIALPAPSVGATENLMIAAVLARGETTIINAAREPEVADLARCLTAMGARIEGAGGDIVRIAGVARLGGAAHRVMSDRIELGTFACLAAATDGELRLAGAARTLLGAAGPVLAAAGVALREEAEDLLVASRAAGGLAGVDVMTQPFPGYATDLQPQIMALLTRADGASMITETLFENRFRHVPELRRMGADIRIAGAHAVVHGVARLHGADVAATDVRAGAALALAALSAEGASTIAGVEHVDRGYDDFVGRLQRCGAAISRIGA